MNEDTITISPEDTIDSIWLELRRSLQRYNILKYHRASPRGVQHSYVLPPPPEENIRNIFTKIPVKYKTTTEEHILYLIPIFEDRYKIKIPKNALVTYKIDRINWIEPFMECRITWCSYQEISIPLGMDFTILGRLSDIQKRVEGKTR